MIAYKLFEKHNGKLYPWFPKIKTLFTAYDPTFIITRSDDCGPFSCFENAEQAKQFSEDGYWDVLYKVRIKQSKDTHLWINGDSRSGKFPEGTIFADEFEILEEVK